ncbi:MAG: CxxC-x17-CxxC domain-containing protein [Candidatus Omnitrophota bacterium]
MKKQGQQVEKQEQNEPDIIVLITMVKQQLASLEKKIDTLLGQSLPKPAVVKPFYKPFQQQVNTHHQGERRQDNRHSERVMYKAICAACGKECEIPFRPREGRPVYCKECFSRHRSGGSFKPHSDYRPREAVAAQVPHIDKPQASEKKKSFGRKKPAERKRPVFKKRKK